VLSQLLTLFTTPVVYLTLDRLLRRSPVVQTIASSELPV
jgi:hypothetical protein